jgi:hypothetical protein
MEPGHEYLVMASHLPLRNLRATVRFFRAVSEVRKQLGSSEGLVAYTLRAKPLARDYWTLSVWSGGDALASFMRTPPHLGVMSSLKPVMGQTRFVQWHITAEDGRPTWSDALARLGGEAR